MHYYKVWQTSFLLHRLAIIQWFIYNIGLMGPGTRCFQYQWVPTANLWVQNTIFNDKSAILLHPGTRWNKNLCAKDAGCAGNKITVILKFNKLTLIPPLFFLSWKICLLFTSAVYIYKRNSDYIFPWKQTVWTLVRLLIWVPTTYVLVEN